MSGRRVSLAAVVDAARGKREQNRVAARKSSVFKSSVDVADLIEFAENWRDLGDAVQSQVKDVLDDSSNTDVNPNAIKLARRELKGWHPDLDDAFKAYFDALEAYEKDNPRGQGD